jgi:serine/threonine protein kinase
MKQILVSVSWLFAFVASLDIPICDPAEYVPAPEFGPFLGGRSVVAVYRHRASQTLYVKKEMPPILRQYDDDDTTEEAQYQAYLTETTILRNLQNMTQTPKLHCQSQPVGVAFTYKDWAMPSLYFLLEYIPWSSLDQFALAHRNPQQLSHILKETALAIQMLHDNHIMHLDIKPSNILTNGTHVKLIDFGGSLAVLSGLGDSKFVHMSSLFKPPSFYSLTSSEADWFSFGATAYYARLVQLTGTRHVSVYSPVRPEILPEATDRNLIQLIQMCVVRHRDVPRVQDYSALESLPYFSWEGTL